MAKSKLNLGCLFWIALILLVIVIILANLKTADEIIHKTGFNKFVEDMFKNKSGGDIQPEPLKTPIIERNDPQATTPNSPSLEPTAKPRTGINDPSVTPTKAPTTLKPEPTKSSIHTEKPNIRDAKIYFVKPNKDGTTTIKGFSRLVRFKDEPLLETMNALLKGTTATESDDGYITTIPEKAKINNIYVKKNVAYLDFNEDFRFNPAGKEGQKAQVSQIVYTCTEFTNVESVMFLIDGKNVDYLGPEGIFIGTPLTRELCEKL